MPESLNVIALISGGKDSLFSLLHCVANGHKVVALANLYPPQPEPSTNVPSATASHDDTSATNDHDEIPDLNSFMYQTVGYSLVPLYASALQIPLYRRPISGTSIQQTQYYDTSSHAGTVCQTDETEDLVPLLQQVLSAHPEANAISTGAILSTYQRTRIESIALRLDLSPIAYLWQYPVLPAPTTLPRRSDSLTGLLDDMAAAGLEARIIKIASAGIAEKRLFANVADPLTGLQLVRGLTPFFRQDEMGLRGAVLGEGGEYETLALSGPRLVWKGGRIKIDEDSSKSFVDSGVAYMSVGRAKVVPAHLEVDQELDIQGRSEHSLVPIPGLFDPQFEHVKMTIQPNGISGKSQRSTLKLPLSPSSSGFHDLQPGTSQASQTARTTSAGISELQVPPHSVLSVTIAAASATVTINNITQASITSYLDLHTQSAEARRSGSTALSAPYAPPMPSETLSNAGDQIQGILDLLPRLLHLVSASHGLAASETKDLSPFSCSNIASTTILLRSMADFAVVNPIYSNIWPPGLPNPPARVTISTDLPADVLVSLSLILHLNPSSSRRGLHVQGRSYWAPANIGPYSQAIAVPLELHVHDPARSQEDDDIDSVHTAGQIPLVPSSMALQQGSFLDSSILSLQHLWRVGQERGVDLWPWGIAYLATSDCYSSHARTASQVWKAAHLTPTWAGDIYETLDQEDDHGDDDGEIVDVWHLQNNRAAYQSFGTAAMPMTLGEHLHLLPNHHVVSHTRAEQHPGSTRLKYIPPFVAAEVIALPRYACVEWWSMGLAGLAKLTSSSSRRRATWRTQLIQHGYNGRSVGGSISCLTVVADPVHPRKTTNFVTYLIASSIGSTQAERIGEHDDQLPVTPLQILSLFSDTVAVDALSINVQLVHGMAFQSLSSQASPGKSGGPRALLDGPLQQLITSMTTIPCRNLWGEVAFKVDAKTQGAISEYVLDTDGDKSPLAAALLMRIDSVEVHE